MWRDVLLWAGPALETGVLAGLIERRHARRAWLLPVLLGALLLSDAARGLFPWAHTWPFWFAKEVLHALLAFALWAEMTVRSFAALPGARRTLVPWLAAVVVIALVLALTLPLGARRVAGGAYAARRSAHARRSLRRQLRGAARLAPSRSGRAFPPAPRALACAVKHS